MTRPTFDEDIKLSGWGSAIYPVGIESLQEAYKGVADDMPRLDILASRVERFILTGQEDNPVTSEGRIRRIAYFYACEPPYRGEFAVLFPEKLNGQFFELVPAIFARNTGEDAREILERLVRDLTTLILDQV